MAAPVFDRPGLAGLRIEHIRDPTTGIRIMPEDLILDPPLVFERLANGGGDLFISLGYNLRGGRGDVAVGWQAAEQRWNWSFPRWAKGRARLLRLLHLERVRESPRGAEAMAVRTDRS